MTERVQITISSVRYVDGEKEEMEVNAVGEHFEKDGTHYIRYDEAGEGTDVVRNMLKLRSDRMEMVKKGAVSSHMVFQQGQTTKTSYMTPAGQLLLEIRTRRLEVLWNEGQLEAETEYSLAMNGQHISDNRVTVRVGGT